MSNIVYKKRSQRIRSKLKKVSPDRYRLTVFRSSKNLSAQIIDDRTNSTLVYATSNNKNLKNKKKNEMSINVASTIAKKAIEKKITKVYFDRGRYKYHGRIKSFAEALRKEGLTF
tara:strand:+ start:122 stop:466 length:345 start_codon:yes stop_codon:yes gene_type:complete